VVESSGAEAGEAAAEKAEPYVAGLRIDFDRGHDAPRQAVLLAPGCDFLGLLVIASQSVFGANPDAVVHRIGPNGEDVVVGQAVFGRDLFPFGVDIGQARIGCRYGRFSG